MVTDRKTYIESFSKLNMVGPVPIDKTNEEILEYLKKNQVEIRTSPIRNIDSQLGVIAKITQDMVYLKNYAIHENVPFEGGHLPRLRLETEILKPIPKQGLVPEPLTKNYIAEFIIYTNYYSCQKIKTEEAKSLIFRNHPLPDKNILEILDEERYSKEQSTDPSKKKKRFFEKFYFRK